MSNDLNTPPELRLDPMSTAPGVTLIDPKMLEGRELVVGAVQQQRHAGAVLNVGRVHLGPKDQATGIDQDVAFAAIDTLRAIVAANAANPGRSDRLAIDDARTRLRVAPDPQSELLT